MRKIHTVDTVTEVSKKVGEVNQSLHVTHAWHIFKILRLPKKYAERI
jgi:hypothetical protein